MKAAHRMGIPWVGIRGDDELASGTCKLKHMTDGTESAIPSAELSVRFAPARR
jgi:histidyl-tRNA synthetase